MMQDTKDLIKKGSILSQNVYVFFKYDPDRPALRFNVQGLMMEANLETKTIEAMFRYVFNICHQAIEGKLITLGEVKMSVNPGLMKYVDFE